jgi:sigma-B regulation protein RsbU (phosphoserine phosphatase)
MYVLIVLGSAGIICLAIRYSRVFHKYSWEQTTREKAEALIKGEIDRIQKIVFSIESIPQNVGYVLEFANPSKENVRVLLDAVVASSDEVFGTCIAFEPYSFDKDSMFYAPYSYKKDGGLVIGNPADTADHYFSEDWYLIPKTLNRSVWIEPYYDAGSAGGNIVMSTYAVPFFSFDGKQEKMHGIIAVDISLEWLSKLVASLKLSEESFAILVSENGTVMGAADSRWPYNESLFSLADENALPILREIGRDLQKGNFGFVKVGPFEGKEDWWIYYRPIPSNKWGILLWIPERG